MNDPQRRHEAANLFPRRRPTTKSAKPQRNSREGTATGPHTGGGPSTTAPRKKAGAATKTMASRRAVTSPKREQSTPTGHGGAEGLRHLPHARQLQLDTSVSSSVAPEEGREEKHKGDEEGSTSVLTSSSHKALHGDAHPHDPAAASQVHPRLPVYRDDARRRSSHSTTSGTVEGQPESARLPGSRAQSQPRAPPALEESLLRSTAIAAAAEAVMEDHHSFHYHPEPQGKAPHPDGMGHAILLGADTIEASSALWNDSYGEHEYTQRSLSAAPRAAATQPVVTEEWARSMIKPGEEHLLYARSSGRAANGYGGIGLTSKVSGGTLGGAGGRRRRGGAKTQATMRALPSASSAAAGRRLEEEARRRQASQMLLESRQTSESNPRVFRSTGTGTRATSYGHTDATSLGRAATVTRSSRSPASVSASLAPTEFAGERSHRQGSLFRGDDRHSARGGAPPLHAYSVDPERLSVEEPHLPPYGSMSRAADSTGTAQTQTSAYCRVLSPVPNPAGGYRTMYSIDSVSPTPSRVLQAAAAARSLDVSYDREQTGEEGERVEVSSGRGYGPHRGVDSGVFVKPNPRVMRRRNSPMLFTQPTVSPGLFCDPASARGDGGQTASGYTSLAGTPHRRGSRATSLTSTHSADGDTIYHHHLTSALAAARQSNSEGVAPSQQQQQQHDLRRQSATEYELMVNLRARMLSQLAEAKDGGGRVSTEAYPQTLAGAHCNATEAASSSADGHATTAVSQGPRVMPSSLRTNGMPRQDGNTVEVSPMDLGRLSLGQRRRPDIVVSLDALKSVDEVEAAERRAASARALAAVRAVTSSRTAPAPTAAGTILNQSSASSSGTPYSCRKHSGDSAATTTTTIKSTTPGRSVSGGSVKPLLAETADEATARLLSDPFFPLTSEENFERLYLCNQEYLARKKLNDRRQLLNYYARAASNAPLPPSLLSTPSNGDLTINPDANINSFMYTVLEEKQQKPSAPARDAVTSGPVGGACVAANGSTSLGRDISTSISRPSGSSAPTLPPRPIRLKGKAAPKASKKLKSIAQTANTGSHKSPPPTASSAPENASTPSVQETHSASKPQRPTPLNQLNRRAAQENGLPIRQQNELRSDVSATSSSETPLLPRRVSLGGASGNVAGAEAATSSARTSPSRSPSRHPSQTPSSTSPILHHSPSPGQSTTPLQPGGGVGITTSPLASSPAFLVNAVMPSAKTGPIAPIGTSNIGYTGGTTTTTAAGGPVGGTQATLGVTSRSTTPTSSRANSVVMLPSPAVGAPGTPGTPATERRASSGTPSSQPSPPRVPSQVSKEDQAVEARIIAEVQLLLSPNAANANARADTPVDRYSKESAAQLEEFIGSYRHHLLHEGFLLTAPSPQTEAATADGPQGVVPPPPMVRKGVRWQGTAAGPFMLALRRETLMEDAPAGEPWACEEMDAHEQADADAIQRRSSDVAAGGNALAGAMNASTGSVGSGHGQPRRQGLHRELKRKRTHCKRSTSETPTPADGTTASDGVGVNTNDDAECASETDDSATASSTSTEGDAACHREDEEVPEDDAFLNKLDDSESHQRNVRYILQIFGAFMQSPSGALSAAQQSKLAVARKRKSTSAPSSESATTTSVAAATLGAPSHGRARALGVSGQGAPSLAAVVEFLKNPTETAADKKWVRSMELMFAKTTLPPPD